MPVPPLNKDRSLRGSQHDVRNVHLGDRHYLPWFSDLTVRTTAATFSADAIGSSCSQIRITRHPFATSSRSVSASRSRFFLTFSAQKSEFVFATV